MAIIRAHCTLYINLRFFEFSKFIQNASIHHCAKQVNRITYNSGNKSAYFANLCFFYSIFFSRTLSTKNLVCIISFYTNQNLLLLLSYFKEKFAITAFIVIQATYIVIC